MIRLQKQINESKGNFKLVLFYIVPGKQYLKYLPVGMSDPNNFGLYDITGNVREVVYDPTNYNESGELIFLTSKGAHLKSEYGCKDRGIRTDQINIGLVRKVGSNGRIGGFRCVVSIEDMLGN